MSTKNQGLAHGRGRVCILGPVKELVEVFTKYAGDGQTRFVFPSEVAAAFWRRWVPRSSAVQAVRSTRFMSWDTFKEEVFPGREGRRPSNAFLRAVFARDLLERNGEEKFLSWFVRPEFASAAAPSIFSRSLRTILPNLKLLLDAAAQRGAPDAALASDLGIIDTLYRDFLEKKGLYEPNFEPLGIPQVDFPVFLFFPGLIEDFASFEEALAGTHRVHLVRPQGTDEVPWLDEYGNSAQEIRGLLTRIAGLLDKGIPAHDIVVTFPNVEAFEDDLLEEAMIQNVPVRIRQGRALSLCPGGNFFSSLAEVESSGFHVDAVKAFLLNGAFPWKDEALLRRVLSVGLEKGCCGSFLCGGKFSDPWRAALAGNDVAEEEKAFFEEFRAAIRRPRRASSFAELRVQAHSFAARFFDAGLWGREAERAFQFSLSFLAELTAEERRLGFPVAEPFSLFTELLQDRIYVSPAAEGGVDVYPYKVSAGVYPRYHFIVNANHAAASASGAALSFLRDDFKEALGLTSEDAGNRFLEVYSSSGENVFVSYSREGRDSSLLPPGFFAGQDRVRPAAGLTEDRKADVSLKELRYWQGREASPFFRAPSFWQREGFIRFSALSRVPALNAAKERLPPGDTVERLAARACEEGQLFFSPTGIEEFAACPFAFFMKRILKIDEGVWETGFDSPLLWGTLCHEALDKFLARAGEAGGFSLTNREALDALADEIVEELFSWLPVRRPSAAAPVRAAWARKMREALKVFARAEAETFPAFRQNRTERGLKVFFEEAGAGLRGRADRISEVPDGGAVLVDYKSGKIPSKSALTGEKREPSSFQIAAYVLMLQRLGQEVSSAWYYALREGKFHRVYGGEGAWLSGEVFQRNAGLLVELLGRSAQRVRAGDYRAASGGCSSPCVFRPVCRTKYALG
ncbi:MAG: PD-(D/E)XK nuclease family protein [Spirochaetales bacterium]|jgi:RecB family exonuclease|nr:PD-(D/E)XK nuclease family protein [Spirochaetales bacterium]